MHYKNSICFKLSTTSCFLLILKCIYIRAYTLKIPEFLNVLKDSLEILSNDKNIPSMTLAL